MTQIFHRLQRRAIHACQGFVAALRGSLSILSQHRRLFHLLQGGYWGLVILAAGAAIYRPGLQLASRVQAESQLDATSVGRAVVRAYKHGRVLEAALWTCLINLSVGAFGTISVASFFAPGSGLALQAYRMVLWGLLFSPVEPADFSFPHFLTMLVEGHAFIIATLGDWLLVRELVAWYLSRGVADAAALKPAAGTETGSEAKTGNWERFWVHYRRGVRSTLRLYPLIASILAVSALWEAYEVIHLPVGWASAH